MQLEILKFIQSFNTPFLDKLFQLITITAEETTIIVLVSIIFWCISKDLGYRLGFVALSGSALNIGIKEAFHTPRPIGQEGVRSLRVETATGYSFPSGHTQSSTSFWLTIMINIKKSLLYIIGIIMFLLVGLSRMYLGVHWPIDVLGGLIIALIWVIVVNRLYTYTRKTHNNLLFLIIIIPMLIGLAFVKDKGYMTACGAMLGFYIGYLIEDKYIKFTTNTSFFMQIVKLVLGLGVLLGLKIGVKMILPQAALSDGIRYAILGLWVTAGAPYIFSKFFKSR